MGIKQASFHLLSTKRKANSMRIVKSLVVAGALVTAVPTLAHAQWYVSGEAGVSLNEKAHVSGGGTNYDTNYNSGYALLGALGYSYGAPKVEVELGYRSNDINTIQGSSASGNVGVFSTMVNGLYDFYPTGVWHPMLGAGVGVGHIDASNVKVGTSSSYSADDWEFAYQGIAAVAYDVTSAWQAKLDYRYFSTLDPNAKINSTNLNAEYHNHSVFLGVTYKFNPPPAPAPTPAPVPVPVAAPAPPPPPPAPMPAPVALKNFIVFFDFDKSSITAQAQSIIEQAAVAAKNGGIVHIQLTGHTDLSGGSAYNQKLSVRRAEAVKAALVKQGLPVSEIDLVGKGKSEPLVPTKDGVREPQNRRVEILLQ